MSASHSEELTMKKLQGHLVKTIAGALVVALLGAVATCFGFYYKTNDGVSSLNISRLETQQDIKGLKIDVADIKLTLSNTGIYTNNNEEQIKQLKMDVNEVKKSQDEMLKLLYEIKAKQK